MFYVKQNIINKRKKNFMNINKFIIFLFFILIIVIIYSFINIHKIVNFSKIYIENYSFKYGFTLETIEVSNLKYLDKNEILYFFKLYKDKSIFLLPIKNISQDIKKNKWIKDIHINSNYKNTLLINIEEEIPLGIYDNDNQKLLFSSNLVVLEIIKNEKKYLELITFYGENSINNSKKLILNFDDEFYNMINSVIYIEKRRWNILLKNEILLKLPEKKIQEALKNYKKIYANFSNKDLKEIKSIDLRISNQAIIEYKEKND